MPEVCHCPKCGTKVAPVGGPPAPSPPSSPATPQASGAPGVKPEWDDAPADNPLSAKFQRMWDYMFCSFDGRGVVYGPQRLKYDSEKNHCIAQNLFRAQGSTKNRPNPKKKHRPLTQGMVCSTLASWVACYWLNINLQWANWIGNQPRKCMDAKYEGKGKHYNADYAAYWTPLEDSKRQPFSYWLAEDRWKQFGEFNMGLYSAHVITLWRIGGRIKVKDRKNGNKLFEPGLYRLAADGSWFQSDGVTCFTCNPLTWKRIDNDKKYLDPKSSTNRVPKKAIAVWKSRNLTEQAKPDGGAFANNPEPILRFGKLFHLETIPTLDDARTNSKAGYDGKKLHQE